jgi:putative membrane protein
LQSVVSVVLYSLIGCIGFAIAFKVLDIMTPNDLWHEILEEHNNALAILVGSIAVGLSIIIAAAIKG